MIFKIIAFLAAAIPIFLFIRSIFFRNADQRRSEGIQEAGQPSSFDISVPNCVCCSLRRRQVGLDVVVVALNERNDGRLKDRKGSRPRCRLAFAPYGCEPRLLVARTSRWAIVVSHL